MTLTVRRVHEDDAEAIVDLFSEAGNPYQWTYDKWHHYYCDYSEGEVVSFVVESEQGLLGHYGLFPVMIGGHRVYMGGHAYVSEAARGLAVISLLIRAVDEFCRANHVPFIVGFANTRFTTVKTRLFGWKTLLYAGFVSTSRFDLTAYRSRPYRFEYSEDWLHWRFGVNVSPVISWYSRGGDTAGVSQLLYAEAEVLAVDFGLRTLECWSPEGYHREPGDQFRQPFSIRIYDGESLEADILAPENWLVQMGDSDTFVYRTG